MMFTQQISNDIRKLDHNYTTLYSFNNVIYIITICFSLYVIAAADMNYTRIVLFLFFSLEINVKYK